MRRNSPEQLELRKNNYQALKEKYVGKESKLALKVKEEALNIEAQR